MVSHAPGTLNWLIGGSGTQVPDPFPKSPSVVPDHLDTVVTPKSLYLQQLQDRLGPQSLANIGYAGAMPTSVDGWKPLEQTVLFDAAIHDRILSFSLLRASTVSIRIYGLEGKLISSFDLSGRPGRNLVVLGTTSHAQAIGRTKLVELSLEGIRQRVLMAILE
jgi:hypothetical protein